MFSLPTCKTILSVRKQACSSFSWEISFSISNYHHYETNWQKFNWILSAVQFYSFNCNYVVFLLLETACVGF